MKNIKANNPQTQTPKNDTFKVTFEDLNENGELITSEFLTTDIDSAIALVEECKTSNFKATMELLTPTIEHGEIITAENIYPIAERISVKALKTNLSRVTKPKQDENGNPINPSDSGFNPTYKLYADLIADIVNHNKAVEENYKTPYSNSADIVSVAVESLLAFMGKALDDTADNGEVDKNGEPITVKKAVFRAVNRYIASNKRRIFKTLYLDDLNESAVAIPPLWDTPTITDYNGVKKLIKAMNLTDRQAEILNKRLQGLSIHEIANRLKVSRTAIQKTLKQIQVKAVEIGLAPTA